MDRRSVLSTKYYQCVVIAPVPVITSDPVAFAFLPKDDKPTASTVVHPGIWVDGRPSILVGPANGGLVLALGKWSAYVKITDSPEVPLEFVGHLQLY